MLHFLKMDIIQTINTTILNNNITIENVQLIPINITNVSEVNKEINDK